MYYKVISYKGQDFKEVLNYQKECISYQINLENNFFTST